MTSNEYLRLCGGTFFVLLQQAVKQRQKARDSYRGDNDGLSSTDMLKSLIRVAQPEYLDPPSSTFAQNTSAYKACNISSSTYLPFSDAAFIATFDNRIKNNYATALREMVVFTNRYIDKSSSSKHVRLVKALLELIALDDSIVDSEMFYVDQSGQPVSKSALCDVINVCLPAFLLGIWHYIVTSRKDNTIGRTTFENWHVAPATNGAQWTYRGNIGEGITREINVTMPETDALEDEMGTSEEAFEDNGTAQEAQPDSGAAATTQILNAPVVFFNSGANCTQINNAGVLNIKRGEKK